jgi:hypothetical protein
MTDRFTLVSAKFFDGSPILMTSGGDNAMKQARSIHWSPYDRVGVVNADP